MKRFIQGEHRGQSTLLPESLDDYVSDTNPVRVVDVFVDELDLASLGFDGVIPAETGRPAYHPAILLKIYIYGYLNRIQSSRRLERNPTISMVNLIDLFLVLIGILLVVKVQNPLNFFRQDKVVIIENPDEADVRMLVKDDGELKRYKYNGTIGEGQGTRAGVTYRLAAGRMIYVPEQERTE